MEKEQIITKKDFIAYLKLKYVKCATYKKMEEFLDIVGLPARIYGRPKFIGIDENGAINYWEEELQVPKNYTRTNLDEVGKIASKKFDWSRETFNFYYK